MFEHASPAGYLAVGRDPSTVPPFDIGRLITESFLDPFLTTALVLAAGLYLLGVHRLRQRGVTWGRARTVAWLLGGLGSIAAVTLTGVGAYDETLFSVHMVQHMVLSMVAPIFLALGAPVTLALRTLPPRGRRALTRLLHTRVARVIGHPLFGFLLFVGSPFALYFTSWYEASLSNVWLHELLHVHFVLVGCVFFWPLIGIDPVPGRVNHPMRMLIIFATLPIHVILGLTIMQSRDLLAPDHYLAHPVPWSDPYSDQRVGGGLLWASGDLVGLVMLGAATYQWMRASEREAARVDRQLDRMERQAALRKGRENGEPGADDDPPDDDPPDDESDAPDEGVVDDASGETHNGARGNDADRPATSDEFRIGVQIDADPPLR